MARLNESDVIIHILRETGPENLWARHVYGLLDFDRIELVNPDSDFALYVGAYGETASYEEMQGTLVMTLVTDFVVRAVIHAKPVPDGRGGFVTDRTGKATYDMSHKVKYAILQSLQGFRFDDCYEGVRYNGFAAAGAEYDMPFFDFRFSFEKHLDSRAIFDQRIQLMWDREEMADVNTRFVMNGVEIDK